MPLERIRHNVKILRFLIVRIESGISAGAGQQLKSRGVDRFAGRYHHWTNESTIRTGSHFEQTLYRLAVFRGGPTQGNSFSIPRGKVGVNLSYSTLFGLLYYGVEQVRGLSPAMLKKLRKFDAPSQDPKLFLRF
jgi:hypothetical protein